MASTFRQLDRAMGPRADVLLSGGKISRIDRRIQAPADRFIDAVARLPWSNVISDAIYAKTDTPHPRMFGAFPKVLREYVAERGLYSLPEAIKRMTSQPAARMNLVGRGSLVEGNWADVLVFDPAVFRDNATFTSPTNPATGLDWCIVNGQVVLEHDCRTDTFSGMCLRIR